MKMKFERFWIVTRPTDKSGLSDICFESNIGQMENQFRGGLESNDILGMYNSKLEAEWIAKKLIKAVA
jgi:hypothetical protein